jgi:hypothetical protein
MTTPRLRLTLHVTKTRVVNNCAESFVNNDLASIAFFPRKPRVIVQGCKPRVFYDSPTRRHF